jgi:hypothetical protein
MPPVGCGSKCRQQQRCGNRLEDRAGRSRVGFFYRPDCLKVENAKRYAAGAEGKLSGPASRWKGRDRPTGCCAETTKE